MKKGILIALFIIIVIVMLIGFALKYGNSAKVDSGISKLVSVIKLKNTDKTVGVITIVLGRYKVFWKAFYETSEKYFLPKYKKQYYVFTNDLNLIYHDKENVHLIYQKKLGWPKDSMMRYDFINSQKDKLKELDYLYFCNVTLLFKKKVGKEVIPNKRHDNLVVAPSMVADKNTLGIFPYERNRHSTAYVPKLEGKYYVQNAFSGGTSDAYIKLSEVCSKNIHTDWDNNINAAKNDESYLNKYVSDKNPLLLPSKYVFSSSFDDEENKKAKIVIRDKFLYGGTDYLRGEGPAKIKSSF